LALLFVGDAIPLLIRPSPLHTEQIAAAFKTFGVADTDTAVLIATIGTTEETVSYERLENVVRKWPMLVRSVSKAVMFLPVYRPKFQAMVAQVAGKPVPLSQLDRLRNEAAIKKVRRRPSTGNEREAESFV
jgi:hypothetical protein